MRFALVLMTIWFSARLFNRKIGAIQALSGGGATLPGNRSFFETPRKEFWARNLIIFSRQESQSWAWKIDLDLLTEFIGLKTLRNEEEQRQGKGVKKRIVFLSPRAAGETPPTTQLSFFALVQPYPRLEPFKKTRTAQRHAMPSVFQLLISRGKLL